MKKWKIYDNNICDLCLDRVTEDSKHYFLDCPYNHNILQNIHFKVGEFIKAQIQMNDAEFLTGIWTITNENKDLLALDKLLYFGQMFVIRSRRSKYPINMENFLEFVIEQFEIEESIKEFRPSKLFRQIAWNQILENFTL